MTYEKPAIVEVAGAIEAVQSSTSKMAPAVDYGQLTTVSAYQSDEQ
jgi:hypothetical protein